VKTYQVTLLLYPFDPGCLSDAVPIPTASFQTNPAGDGIGQFIFHPEDVLAALKRCDARHPLGGHERKLNLEHRLLKRDA
jgi:hypothetical protein